jgi:D-tyrosyl-tRNA(Tyr) deacylase
MRFLIQEVHSACVAVVAENYKAEIWKWILIYVWIHRDDIPAAWEKIKLVVEKLPQLQILHKDGKLIWTLQDMGWEILLISNFTLYGENRKGNRFDFGNSAWFEDAKRVYDDLVDGLKGAGLAVKIGVFGGFMEVSSVNAGPINLLWEV